MATRENSSEINEVIRKLEKTVFVFSKRDRKGLLTKAAAPPRRVMRQKTKVSDRKRKRVNKKGGRSYTVGNLKRSMKTLRKLKKTDSVFVGPDFGRGSKEGADGFYFAMAYGTPAMVGGKRKRLNALKNYREELLLPAARESKRASIEAFRKDFAKRFGTRAAQQKLDVS
jgi:hypothetical protein